ncbi:MAG: hypothetical protein HZB68_00620 [Candidatus Aenigmarchaeota archaeon]|nr:hypothetical protein [Candidatus Aenigmarchaeota archaeon]
MNKNLLKMAKEHSDPTIQDKVTGIKEVDEDLMEQAERVYMKIKENVGRNPNKGNMYYDGTSYNSSPTSNALVGILAKLLDYDKEAEDIYDSLRAKRGDYLYYEDNGIYGHLTYSNALVGTLASMLGINGDAEGIYTAINNNIGKNKKGLYNSYLNPDVGKKEQKSEALGNSCMALFGKSLGMESEAKETLNMMEIAIPKSGKLFCENEDSSRRDSLLDLSTVAMYRSLEMGNESSIAEKEINLDKDSFFSLWKSRFPTSDAALLGICYCLKAGKELK